MSEATMLLIKALIFGMIFTGVLGFFFIRYMSKHTETAVTRLNRETEAVRTKQVELTAKIKDASDELAKRRKEADALVVKMKDDAAAQAQAEREKIIQKARADAEDIINKAHHTKDEVRRELEKEVNLKAVDLGILVLKEFLSQNAAEAMDKVIIPEFVKDLAQVDMGLIGADVTAVEVLTARPLEESVEKQLATLLQEKLNRPIGINKTVDESLVGGILLKFASLSLDGSLKHLMQTLSEQTKEKLEKGLL
jgi:F0F1-type ATP synthase membrane subunit b/b'